MEKEIVIIQDEEEKRKRYKLISLVALLVAMITNIVPFFMIKYDELDILVCAFPLIILFVCNIAMIYGGFFVKTEKIDRAKGFNMIIYYVAGIVYSGMIPFIISVKNVYPGFYISSIISIVYNCIGIYLPISIAGYYMARIAEYSKDDYQYVTLKQYMIRTFVLNSIVVCIDLAIFCYIYQSIEF